MSDYQEIRGEWPFGNAKPVTPAVKQEVDPEALAHVDNLLADAGILPEYLYDEPSSAAEAIARHHGRELLGIAVTVVDPEEGNGVQA